MTTPAGHTSAIRASKVIGTSVYNGAGEKIGKPPAVAEKRIIEKTDVDAAVAPGMKRDFAKHASD